jgi:hypothetical protein
MKFDIPTGPDLPPFWTQPQFELANDEAGAFGHVSLTANIIKGEEVWHAYAVVAFVADRFEGDFPTAQQAIDAVEQWYRGHIGGSDV